MNRGTTATNHSEECRKRLAEELEKVEDERLARETERLFGAGSGKRSSSEKQGRNSDGNGFRR